MLHQNLYHFVTVVECGSLTKAAAQLFLSPTSVMKQLNAFEEELGVTLTIRTKQGITLTPAGEVIYEEGKRLIKEAQDAIRRARALEAQADEKIVIRIGTSSLYPASILTVLWEQAGLMYYHEAKRYKIELVQIHDSVDDAIEILGRTVDIIVRLCDSQKLRRHVRIEQLGYCRFNCAVPVGSDLAGKDRLQPSDFAGHKITVYDRTDSPINNILAQDLERIPGIQIAEAPYFNLELFNRCSNENSILLVNTLWKELHPSLIIKEVDWNYKVPLGMLYSQNSPKEIGDFVLLLAKVNESIRAYS